MLKARIIGMGNECNFNYVIVRKNKDFFKWLSTLLKDSFDISYGVEYEEPHEDKNGGWINRKKQIRYFVDKNETYRDKKSRIDIFYGKDKVFITINTSLSKRRKFIENLKKISIWKKTKK